MENQVKHVFNHIAFILGFGKKINNCNDLFRSDIKESYEKVYERDFGKFSHGSKL